MKVVVIGIIMMPEVDVVVLVEKEEEVDNVVLDSAASSVKLAKNAELQTPKSA